MFRKWKGAVRRFSAGARLRAGAASADSAVVARTAASASAAGIAFDLAPQGRHAAVHAPRGDHDGVSPDGIHDPIAGQRPPGAL